MSLSINMHHDRDRPNKILILNRFYWPDNSATAQLLTDLAEHLAEQGGDVIVITSRHRYDDSKAYLPNRDKHHKVRIHRVWTFPGSRRSLAIKLLNFISFYAFATLALFRLLRGGDMIIAKSDPPLVAIIPWLLSRLRRATVINWCQDLYPEIAVALGVRWADGSLGRVLRALRNHSLQCADMTVAISTSMQDRLIKEGVEPAKTCLIHNWCDQHILPLEGSSNKLRTQWNLANQFVMAYSGNLGRAHLAEHVYALVEALAEHPNLKMLFIGGGPGMVWLQNQCQERGHRHVVFKPYQPRDRLSVSLSVADLHLISLHPACQAFIFPSKYYGILAAGRPIAYLGDPGSELAREVDKAALGLVLDRHRRENWRDQITNLQRDDTRRRQFSMNARRLYERQYTAPQALAQWQQLVAKHQPTDSITEWRDAA